MRPRSLTGIEKCIQAKKQAKMEEELKEAMLEATVNVSLMKKVKR